MYNAGGEIAPGMKGVALKPDEWDVLQGCTDSIDLALSRIGRSFEGHTRKLIICKPQTRSILLADVRVAVHHLHAVVSG